jgi:uncharacterized membrane protein
MGTDEASHAPAAAAAPRSHGERPAPRQSPRQARWRPSGAARGLIPALVCTVTALGVLGARVVLAESHVFVFLAWNLVLAWAPFLISLLAVGLVARGVARWWNLAPLAVAFILFLPNAPYLVTDFVHLYPRPGVPLWADIALLSNFAGTGWLLGLMSLHVWRRLVEARFGRGVGWASTGAAALLCGHGIYLGRFLRWNSWDVLAAPGELLASVLAYLGDRSAHPQMLGVTVLFGALLMVSYAVFELLRTDGSDDNDAPPAG